MKPPIKYLLYCSNSKVAAFVEVERYLSGDYYGLCHDKFYAEYGQGEYPYESTNFTTIYSDDYSYINGVLYEWWLSGPDGAAFLVFQLPGVTDEQIEAVKKHIGRTQDATSITVFKVSKLVDFEMPEITHEMRVEQQRQIDKYEVNDPWSVLQKSS